MRILQFILYNFKTTLFLIGGVFVVCFMSRNLSISLSEKAPTPIRIDRWAADYHGERWLRLTGVGSAKLAASRTETAFVPVVPQNYRRRDPVHAVIIASPDRVGEFSGPVTVEGVLAPPGAWDLHRVLPGVVFAPDVVCLNPGTTPDGPGLSIGFMLLGVFIGLLAGYRLYAQARSFFEAGASIDGRTV